MLTGTPAETRYTRRQNTQRATLSASMLATKTNSYKKRRLRCPPFYNHCDFPLFCPTQFHTAQWSRSASPNSRHSSFSRVCSPHLSILTTRVVAALRAKCAAAPVVPACPRKCATVSIARVRLPPAPRAPRNRRNQPLRTPSASRAPLAGCARQSVSSGTTSATPGPTSLLPPSRPRRLPRPLRPPRLLVQLPQAADHASLATRPPELTAPRYASLGMTRWKVWILYVLSERLYS